MADALLVAGSVTGTYLGMALLALRQRAHYRAVSARTSREPAPAPVRARLLRYGSACLTFGVCSSWLAEGASFGSLLWLLVAAGSGMAVTFTLTWKPRWLRCLVAA